MPISKIVGIDSRDIVNRETGEVRTITVVHYTYKANEKTFEGVGADNVFFDISKFDLPDLGKSYLIEKDKRGYLSNCQSLESIIGKV